MSLEDIDLDIGEGGGGIKGTSARFLDEMGLLPSIIGDTAVSNSIGSGLSVGPAFGLLDTDRG